MTRSHHASPGHRYIFVGGLHRSGTTLASRLIASLPHVGSIQNAPVPENEGVYLQGAIPHGALHGRPMEFATDLGQHLTEGHPLNNMDTRMRMEADWDSWFTPSPLWRVEKSPVNLTRTRLLQQLFPLSHFVIVLRHPSAVIASVSKWVTRPADHQMRHWVDAYAIAEHDARHLHHVLFLRYEDIVANPRETLTALASFLRIDDPVGDPPEMVHDGNRRYRETGPSIPDELRDQIMRWGYGPDLSVLPVDLPLNHALNETASRTREILRQ